LKPPARNARPIHGDATRPLPCRAAHAPRFGQAPPSCTAWRLP